MATAQVALDPSQYVRVNNGLNPILLQSLRDDVRLAFADSQPAFTNSVYHLLGGSHRTLQMPGIDTNLWALATTEKCSLITTENSNKNLLQDNISLGNRPDVSQFNKFAYRAIVTGGSNFRTVWNYSGDFTLLKSASTFTITYNSSTDGNGTTGALVLLISYIDENEERQQAVHVLGNTGTDVTSFSGLGINRIAVTSSGSNDVNENDILVTATTGGTNQAIVPAGTGVTQQAIFFAPDDALPITKWMWINAVKTSGGQYPLINIRGWVYSRIVDTRFLIFEGYIDTEVTNEITLNDPCNFPLSRRDVIWFEMQSSTNGAAASLRFSTNLYDD